MFVSSFFPPPSPDGYIYDKEAILENILHQKKESKHHCMFSLRNVHMHASTCCTYMLSHGFYSVWDMYRTRAVCTSEGGARGSTYSTRPVHIPCTVKTMRQLSCTIDSVRLPLSARMSILVRTVR